MTLEEDYIIIQEEVGQRANSANSLAPLTALTRVIASHTLGICSAIAHSTGISHFLHLIPISGLPVAWTPQYSAGTMSLMDIMRQPQVWIVSLCFGVWKRVEHPWAEIRGNMEDIHLEEKGESYV